MVDAAAKAVARLTSAVANMASEEATTGGATGEVADAVIAGDPATGVVDVAFDGGRSSSSPTSSGRKASVPWAVSMDALLAEGLALGAAFGDNATCSSPPQSARAMEAFVLWVEAGGRERGAVRRLAPALNPRVVVAGLLGNQAGDRDGDLWRNLQLRVWTADSDNGAGGAAAASGLQPGQPPPPPGAWGNQGGSGSSGGGQGGGGSNGFGGALAALARLNANMEAEAKVMASLGPDELTFVMNLLQGTYKGEAAAAADALAHRRVVTALDQALREAVKSTAAEVSKPQATSQRL